MSGDSQAPGSRLQLLPGRRVQRYAVPQPLNPGPVLGLAGHEDLTVGGDRSGTLHPVREIGEILVERESQKGIVIGRRGAVLKEVGTAVRRQMPEGVYLELFVRVEKRWQQREDALDKLGL